MLLTRINFSGRDFPEGAACGGAPLTLKHDAVFVIQNNDCSRSGMPDHFAGTCFAVGKRHRQPVHLQEAPGEDRIVSGNGLGKTFVELINISGKRSHDLILVILTRAAFGHIVFHQALLIALPFLLSSWRFSKSRLPRASARLSFTRPRTK